MTTKHTHENNNFGRRVEGCPRCDELKRGAKPIPTWGSAKRQADAQRLADIRNHDCTRSRCGPVCTFGDW